MTSASTLRRITVLAVSCAAGGALLLWMRERRPTGQAPAPEWPPFEPPAAPSGPAAGAPGATSTGSGADDEPPGWVAPPVEGGVPDGHPVKVKLSSGIFHLPGGRFYDRTVADRFYTSAEAAVADGYRQSKS